MSAELKDLRQAILELGLKAAAEASRDLGSVDAADRSRLTDISIRALQAIDEFDQKVQQREAAERLIAEFGPIFVDLLNRLPT